jgi:hypothetical protein
VDSWTDSTTARERVETITTVRSEPRTRNGVADQAEVKWDTAACAFVTGPSTSSTATDSCGERSPSVLSWWRCWTSADSYAGTPVLASVGGPSTPVGRGTVRVRSRRFRGRDEYLLAVGVNAAVGYRVLATRSEPFRTADGTTPGHTGPRSSHRAGPIPGGLTLSHE